MIVLLNLENAQTLLIVVCATSALTLYIIMFLIMRQMHTKPKVITTAIHNLEIKGFNTIKNGREIDDRLRASYRFKRGLEEYHPGINSNDRTDTNAWQKEAIGPDPEADCQTCKSARTGRATPENTAKHDR